MALFSRIQPDKALDHPNRRRIRDVIEAEPGIHHQALVRRLSLGKGTTEHHVRKLVEAGLVQSKVRGGYRCYFPKGASAAAVAEAGAARSPTAKRVLQAIGQQPGVNGAGLASSLGLNRGTVLHHTRRLLDAGVVRVEVKGASKRYWRV